MRKLFWVFAVILVSVSSFQCQRDISFIGRPDNGISVTPQPITTSLQGIITDENDRPFAGVMVTAGTGNAITDENGFFHLNNIILDKNTSMVTAEKGGYFKAYRIFAATSGCNQVTIKLLKRNLAGTVDASKGGDVSLSNGAKINLSANGIVTAASGSAYSGNVSVYASYINPKSEDIDKIVPGSFVANDKDGKRVLLSSYGMLAVELASANGEKLQIKEGSVAILTIPIPLTSVAAAQASIPLWFIDEKTGLWQEEGTATKQGNNYVGEVKHFSFWNCDYPLDGVNLSLTLHTPDDLPLVNTAVKISTATDSVSSAYGWTDSLGQVKGMVPANKNLKLEVLDPCGNSIYSQNIESLTQSIDLGTIKIAGANSHLLTFTGTLVNCSGAPVTKGYAIINLNGAIHYVAPNSTGQFTTTYVTCSGVPATSTVLAIDEDAQQQSALTSIPVSSPITNAGDILVCGTSSEQYINYKLDNVAYSITGSTGDTSIRGYRGYTSSGITNIAAYDFTTAYNEINFSANATAAGTFPVSNFSVRDYYSIRINQPFDVIFTNFPANAGEFYIGTLSGTFTDSLSNIHTVSATFKVRNY